MFVQRGTPARLSLRPSSILLFINSFCANISAGQCIRSDCDIFQFLTLAKCLFSDASYGSRNCDTRQAATVIKRLVPDLGNPSSSAHFAQLLTAIKCICPYNRNMLHKLNAQSILQHPIHSICSLILHYASWSCSWHFQCCNENIYTALPLFLLLKLLFHLLLPFLDLPQFPEESGEHRTAGLS